MNLIDTRTGWSIQTGTPTLMTATPPSVINPTANQFFNAWFATVQEMKTVLAADWRTPALFTGRIKSSEDCVVRAVSRKLNLHCYPHDYYSVDAVMYSEEDRVPGTPEGSTCLRGLAVAFEHENDIRGIHQEIAHLLIVNADLRVLVTYPNDEIDGPEWQRAHAVIRGARNQKQISDDGSFLVIIGWETGFEWQGYVYQEDGWKQVAGAEI